jgi:hypothetical protein
MSADLSLSIGCTRRWYSNSLWLDRHALPISVGAVDLTLPVHDLLHRALRRHVRAVSHLDACAGRNKHFATLGLSLHVLVVPLSDPDRFGMWELSSFQSVVHTPPSRGGDLLVAHLQPAVHGNDSRPSTLPTTERACLHPGTWVLYSSMSLELDATRSNYCVPPMTFRPDAEPPTHPHGMKDVPQQGYCVSVFPPSYGCVFLMHTSRHPSKRRHI